MAANAKASHEHLKRGESSGQEADQQCVQCDQPGEPAARRAWLSRCVRRPNKDQIFFFSLSLSRIERRTPNADASQPSMSRGKIRRVRRQGIQRHRPRCHDSNSLSLFSSAATNLSSPGRCEQRCHRFAAPVRDTSHEIVHAATRDTHHLSTNSPNSRHLALLWRKFSKARFSRLLRYLTISLRCLTGAIDIRKREREGKRGKEREKEKTSIFRPPDSFCPSSLSFSARSP